MKRVRTLHVRSSPTLLRRNHFVGARKVDYLGDFVLQQIEVDVRNEDQELVWLVMKRSAWMKED